jgi:hypothetical protein
MEIAPEIMSSTESLNEDSKNYTISLKRFANAAEVADMIEAFNTVPNNKRFNLGLIAQLLPVKKSGPKKKKLPMPYTINSFIFYTSLLSKAGIKLKKDSKSWQFMGVNPETQQVVDENGHRFRQVIACLEDHHKTLYVYDDAPTNKVVNVEKTDEVRRRAIAYSQHLLAACYNDEPVELPTDEFSKRIYKHLDAFKEAVQCFKTFLNEHKFLKTEGDEEEQYEAEDGAAHPALKKNPSKVTKAEKVKNMPKLTLGMVSDMKDNDLIS